VRIDVAFAPGVMPAAPVTVVVDVIRATTTITHAVGHGYSRVLACGDIDQARELGRRLANGAVLAGERDCVKPEGFDLGNSPSEYGEGPPLGETLVLATTNGTRAIVAAAADAEAVLIGSLANLTACAARAARIARDGERDVLVQCAGVEGAFALDDAYVAGRFVAELRVWLAEWGTTDAATAAEVLADAYPSSADAPRGFEQRRQPAGGRPRRDLRACARRARSTSSPGRRRRRRRRPHHLLVPGNPWGQAPSGAWPRWSTPAPCPDRVHPPGGCPARRVHRCCGGNREWGSSNGSQAA
jgi:2-phosphosulfolactate phosphatase